MKNDILVPSLGDPVICVSDKSFPSPLTEDRHVHSEYEFVLISEGEAVFHVNEEAFHLGEGDVFFIKGGVEHMSRFESGASCISVNCITADLKNEIVQALNYFSNSGNEKEVCLFEAGSHVNAQLRGVLEDIGREHSERERAYDKFIRADVLRLFSILYRNSIMLDPTTIFSVGKVEKLIPLLYYVDEHYNESIDSNTICGIVNMDYSHFCRLFREAVNTNFKNYHNFIKNLHAMQLLRTTDKSVAEIAAETGFSSATYFTKVIEHFTRKAQTPGSYRRTFHEDIF